MRNKLIPIVIVVVAILTMVAMMKMKPEVPRKAVHKEQPAVSVYIVKDEVPQVVVKGFGIVNAKEKITVANLLKGLLVKSGNDAALTLAIYHSQSLIKFVDEMKLIDPTISVGATAVVNFSKKGSTKWMADFLKYQPSINFTVVFLFVNGWLIIFIYGPTVDACIEFSVQK